MQQRLALNSWSFCPYLWKTEAPGMIDVLILYGAGDQTWEKVNPRQLSYNTTPSITSLNPDNHPNNRSSLPSPQIFLSWFLWISRGMSLDTIMNIPTTKLPLVPQSKVSQVHYTNGQHLHLTSELPWSQFWVIFNPSTVWSLCKELSRR